MHSILSPIKSKVNNVFIHVSNLQKSAEWYCNLLGVPCLTNQIKSPVYNVPVTGETGLTLDDHTFDPQFQFQPSGNVLFNFYTADIDEAYAYIKQKNITIVKEIERLGDFAYFNFEDLDGNILMICNN